MELGFTTMNTPEDVDPAELARALEARGFTSLWIGEHSHIPASRTHAVPGGRRAARAVPTDDGPVPQPARRRPGHHGRCGSGRASPCRSSTTCSRWPSRWRRSIACRAAGSTSAWAWAGTSRSWPTTDPTSRGRRVTGRWRSASLPSRRCGATTRPSTTAAGSTSTRCGPIRSRCRCRTRRSSGAWRDGSAPRTRSRGPTQWMPMDLALGNVAKRVGRFRAAVAEAGRPPMPIVLTTWGDPTARPLPATRELGIERVVLGAGRDGLGRPDDRPAVPRALRRARPGARG